MVEVNQLEVSIPPYGDMDVNEKPGVLFDYSRENGYLLGERGKVRLMFPVGQAVDEEDSASVDLMISPEDPSKFVTMESVDVDDLRDMFELGLAFLDFDSKEGVTSLIGYNIGDSGGWKKSNQSWGNLHLKAIRFTEDFERIDYKRREVEDAFADRSEEMLRRRYTSGVDGVEIVERLPVDLQPLVAKEGSLVLKVTEADPSKMAETAVGLDKMYREAFSEEVLTKFYKRLESSPDKLIGLEDNKRAYLAPTYTCTIMKYEDEIYWVFHPNYFVKAGPYEGVGVQGRRTQTEYSDLDKRLERAREEADRLLA